MQIWYMESYPIGDRRMPHHVFPPKMLSLDQLQQLVGVVSYKVSIIRQNINTVIVKIQGIKREFVVGSESDLKTFILQNF